MSARSFTSFLQAEPALKPLLQQLSELDYFQELLRKCVPPSLAALGQVGSFRNGTLNVVAKNGPAAAKLKQIVPDLEEKLSQLVGQAIQVHVNVHLDNIDKPKQATRRNKPVLSTVALSSLGKLEAELPPSALRTEVSTLLKRQGRRP